MNVRYRIELSQAERDELTTMLSGGKHAARKLKRAQILLGADAGSSDDEIACTVAVGGSTAKENQCAKTRSSLIPWESHRFKSAGNRFSWLNMVEIEIGVLRGQCLDRRIEGRKRLRREIAAWERQ